MAMFAGLFLILLAVAPLRAVEDNGNFDNDSDPGSSIPNWTAGWPGSGTDGWNYVGQVNGASGTYLGNGWVITAAHVGAGSFTLGGITYTLVSGSTTEIDGGDVDITLFQIASPPSIPPLPLQQTTPVPFGGGAADSVAMIGYGGGHGETWGFNTVSGVDDPFSLLGRTTIDFYTTNGTVTIGTQSVTNNAMLISGDSGGGDFIFNATAGTWELAGINEATGGSSFLVEISAYVQQILDITGLPAPPAITTEPASLSTISGSSLTLSVSANGSSPLSYQWLKNGAPISSATSATFSITSAAPADSGSYSVTISNAHGSTTSSMASISVAALTLSGLPPTQIVIIGQSATFSVTAQGAGPFNYQWMLNGAAISGATENSYSIMTVGSGSAGNYSVAVSNVYGYTTSNAATLVPVVSQQVIQSTQSVTFTAVPGAGGPFTYQWQFNGTGLSGATGQSYTISDAQPNQGGIYTVIITGPDGSTSSSYSLVVNSPQTGDVPALPRGALALLALLLVLAGARRGRFATG